MLKFYIRTVFQAVIFTEVLISHFHNTLRTHSELRSHVPFIQPGFILKKYICNICCKSIFQWAYIIFTYTVYLHLYQLLVSSANSYQSKNLFFMSLYKVDALNIIMSPP